ncbi:hypothetical protein [Teredinibacter turnerae]|uniref:hypothetical protein n=1 Tax=Teredinibacter turnerae TaxID=2426 RepID=UPI00037A1B46|nr:hypothetical protein [Teredinibacter turnerae]
MVEKHNQIESLEDKHGHGREAMEHYRQSVKEQREQDQRNHEQQRQQLQAEIRALNQTISVKQAELTHLYKDNGRLAAELASSQKSLLHLESEQRNVSLKLEHKTEEVDSLKLQISKRQSYAEELDSFKKKNEELHAWKTAPSVTTSKLEVELSVKTDMINRLLEEKEKNKIPVTNRL